MLPVAFLLTLVAPVRAEFVKGPYLQRVTQTSMIVSWETEDAQVGEVRYGATVDMDHMADDGEVTTFHQLELTGLEPSGIYYYQIRAGAEKTLVNTFTTAPYTDEPFTFVVIGDTRTDTKSHSAVISRVIATGAPDLYFNTGDLVEAGDDPLLWNEFFSLESGLMALAPFFPTAGNHDDVENDSYFGQFFEPPTSPATNEGWYEFQYGNSWFCVVDTEDDYTFGSEQSTWLESAMAAADANPDIRHKFVFFHDPPYTSGAHGVFTPEDWQGPRTYLVPLLDTYGVDVVFNGHDHHYERSDTSQTNGVMYIVTGGGGAPGAPEDFVDGLDSIVKYLGMSPGETVGEYLEENWVILKIMEAFGYGAEYEGGWWRAEAEVMKHFVLVEVQGDLVTGTVITDGGSVFETWSLGTYDGDVVDDDGDGWSEEKGDCDDANAAVNPDADEVCDDKVDNDCDGEVDEDCAKPKDTSVPDETDIDTDDGSKVDTGTKVTQPGKCGCATPVGASGLFSMLIALWGLGRRTRGSPVAAPRSR